MYEARFSDLSYVTVSGKPASVNVNSERKADINFGEANRKTVTRCLNCDYISDAFYLFPLCSFFLFFIFFFFLTRALIQTSTVDSASKSEEQAYKYEAASYPCGRGDEHWMLLGRQPARSAALL